MNFERRAKKEKFDHAARVQGIVDTVNKLERSVRQLKQMLRELFQYKTLNSDVYNYIF